MSNPSGSFRDSSRKEVGNRLKGSAGDGKERAHKVGHEVLKVAIEVAGGPGRPLQNRAAGQAVDHRTNWTPKTVYANRVLDERRDERLIEAMLGNMSISEKTTVHRATQVYDGALAVADAYAQQHGRRCVQLDNASDAIGNLAVRTGEVGRPRLVKNIPKGGMA